MCYNDIIMVHHKVRELWYNAYAHTSGPQVEKIFHKSLLVFPWLESLRVEDVVYFYDHLQEVSMGFVLALRPSTPLSLQTDLRTSAPRALACLDTWLYLVPGSLSPQLGGVLASVRYESNNKYDYLWQVLELALPGFDPTVPIEVPIWSNIDVIFHFAQSFLLYFRLQAKLNIHYVFKILGYGHHPPVTCEFIP